MTFLAGNRLAKIQNFAACILIIVCMLLAAQALAFPAHRSIIFACRCLMAMKDELIRGAQAIDIYVHIYMTIIYWVESVTQYGPHVLQPKAHFQVIL